MKKQFYVIGACILTVGIGVLRYQLIRNDGDANLDKSNTGNDMQEISQLNLDRENIIEPLKAVLLAMDEMKRASLNKIKNETTNRAELYKISLLSKNSEEDRALIKDENMKQYLEKNGEVLLFQFIVLSLGNKSELDIYCHPKSGKIISSAKSFLQIYFKKNYFNRIELAIENLKDDFPLLETSKLLLISYKNKDDDTFEITQNIESVKKDSLYFVFELDKYSKYSYIFDPDSGKLLSWESMSIYPD